MSKEQNNTDFKFGWIPDLPDNRDLRYAAAMATVKQLPAGVDLRAGCPPVVDQQTLGSCTSNAGAGAFQFDQIRQGIPNFPLSRLFIYYNTRSLEGTVDTDSGASIRDTIRSMNQFGCCSEQRWPYNIDDFTTRPDESCYKNGLDNQILQYNRLDNCDIIQLKSCLADGYPFIFGFTVKQSFRNIGPDGLMPVPAPNERVLGGHAVMAVGYDDDRQVFIVRNSWNDKWGDHGYFYMPYVFITDSGNADDFWTITLVEKGLQMTKGNVA